MHLYHEAIFACISIMKSLYSIVLFCQLVCSMYGVCIYTFVTPHTFGKWYVLTADKGRRELVGALVASS